MSLTPFDPCIVISVVKCSIFRVQSEEEEKFWGSACGARKKYEVWSWTRTRTRTLGVPYFFDICRPFLGHLSLNYEKVEVSHEKVNPRFYSV